MYHCNAADSDDDDDDDDGDVVGDSNSNYYPHDAMLARSLRQRRVCPSGRPSVTRRYCAKQDREMYTV